jgi:RNA polymerase sigma-70 factor (ECF subfamily)
MTVTDENLVEGLKTGSEDAFEQFYHRYSQSLLRHLYCLMGNQEEAEELLHECMMLMIQKINFYIYQPTLKNSFKAWLFRLSTNRAIDEIRKRKSNQVAELEVVDTAPSQDKIYEEREDERFIGDLLMKLPLMQRTVLSLRVQEDLSYMEISAICGKDINTIKQGLFHARRAMKNLLLAHEELL